MEPNLACASIGVNVASVTVNAVGTSSTSSSNVVCFNCSGQGHFACGCPQSPKSRCFRCDNPDVTVKTCPICSKGIKRSGNAAQRG